MLLSTDFGPDGRTTPECKARLVADGRCPHCGTQVWWNAGRARCEFCQQDVVSPVNTPKKDT